MHQPQQRMNNTRSAVHIHEFDRMDMRGESRSYEAGGEPGRGEVSPPTPCPGMVRESFPARLGTPGAGHHSRVVSGGVTVGVARWFPRRLLQLRCAGRPSPRIAPPEARDCRWSYVYDIGCFHVSV